MACNEKGSWTIISRLVEEVEEGKKSSSRNEVTTPPLPTRLKIMEQ